MLQFPPILSNTHECGASKWVILIIYCGSCLLFNGQILQNLILRSFWCHIASMHVRMYALTQK